MCVLCVCVYCLVSQCGVCVRARAARLATSLMATLSYQRAIIGGVLGEGAAISNAMIPFLLAAIIVSWFGLQRRKWQQGENND